MKILGCMTDLKFYKLRNQLEKLIEYLKQQNSKVDFKLEQQIMIEFDYYNYILDNKCRDPCLPKITIE